jgi:hypothetical protein
MPRYRITWTEQRPAQLETHDIAVECDPHTLQVLVQHINNGAAGLIGLGYNEEGGDNKTYAGDEKRCCS